MTSEIREGMFAAYWEGDGWDEAFDTEGDAIKHVIRAYGLTPGDKLVVGPLGIPEEPEIDGPAIMERLNDNLHQQAGDVAEFWPGDALGPDGVEELGKVLTVELMKLLREKGAWPPGIFVVEDPKEIEVTHDLWVAACPELADEDEEIEL